MYNNDRMKKSDLYWGSNATWIKADHSVLYI